MTSGPSANDRLLDCGQAAVYLGMSTREFRRLVAERELAVVRRGYRGRIKVRLSELDRWIKRNSVPATR